MLLSSPAPGLPAPVVRETAATDALRGVLSGTAQLRDATASHDGTVIGGFLTRQLFGRLSGTLAGHRYVKVVVDRSEKTWHLLDSAVHAFHVKYIATEVLGMRVEQLMADIDSFNASVYADPERRFLLGILSLHHGGPGGRREFMVLETTEADRMDARLLTEFHDFTRAHLDPSLPLCVKPATHAQEAALAGVPESRVPRILSHELYAAADFVALRIGSATGRLRWFRTPEDYRAARESLRRHDILAMPLIPDDVPRVSGLINGTPTTPLSHTNVLAAGWDIPNSVVLDIEDRVVAGELDGTWVRYEVSEERGLDLSAVPAPAPGTPAEPRWRTEPVRVDPPDTGDAPVLPLARLRAADRVRYGTKAANLGELHHLLRHGSAAMLGYFATPRPPRSDLFPHLARHLRLSTAHDLPAAARGFLSGNVDVPAGMAVPFSFQERFFTGSPAIRQCLGRLEAALHADALHAVDEVCLRLTNLVRTVPLPDDLVRALAEAYGRHLPGAHPLLVRSSSNAEDLAGFPAAGIYESAGPVTGLPGLLDAVREVWASLVSARSVRLRHEAGIAPGAARMGAIVQRVQAAAVGGVMVTCDPTRPQDFRSLFLNCAPDSASAVVEGGVLPMQYLYNTVEGGGRTVSLGSAGQDLDAAAKDRLFDLAVVGRLLQGHFAAGPVDRSPLDVEWLLTADGRLCLLQVRPYRT